MNTKKRERTTFIGVTTSSLLIFKKEVEEKKEGLNEKFDGSTLLLPEGMNLPLKIVCAKVKVRKERQRTLTTTKRGARSEKVGNRRENDSTGNGGRGMWTKKL